MKKNDSGDFSILYIEPGDERTTLFPVIVEQRKPTVLMLAQHTRVFQRSEDFTLLKRVRPQREPRLIFVIPQGGRIAQLASKYGFPVYLSMDHLIDAISSDGLAQQRMPMRQPEVERARRIDLEQGHRPMRQATSDVTNRVPTGVEGDAARIEQMLHSSQSNNPVTPMPAFTNTQPLQGEEITRPLPPFMAADTDSGAQDQQERYETRFAPPLHVQDRTYAQAVQEKRIQEPPAAAQTNTTNSMPKPVVQRSRYSWVLIALVVALLLGTLGSLFFFLHPVSPTITTPAAPMSVGTLTFTSSEQVTENSTEGIEDQVVLTLHNLANPAPQMRYYGWLLGDKNQGEDTQAFALGALQVKNGKVVLTYQGDAQHDNLLLMNGRFLITEESATTPPIAPSPNTNTWRYYGAFPDNPIPGADNPNHYSYLDHLRHLLASDPTLNKMKLPGGLNNWLFLNTGKVYEWSSGTREAWGSTAGDDFIRREATRILQYLDGTTFVYKDLPPNTPLQVSDRLASVGLLEVNGANQEPPSYLQHIDTHLNGLLTSGQATPGVHQQIASMITAMNNTESWFQQVHSDARALLRMSNAQMQQKSTLGILNDMISNANYALTGQLDVSTNTMKQGVTWLHTQMQQLATMEIHPYSAGKSNVPRLISGTSGTIQPLLYANMPGEPFYSKRAIVGR
jgi:hypothetical protein